MLIRIVRMTFAAGEIPAFRALFEQTKNQIRQQPGCLHLELWQDADQSRIFCTHSHWQNQAALDMYRRSELFGQVWSATKKLFAAPALVFSSLIICD